MLRIKKLNPEIVSSTSGSSGTMPDGVVIECSERFQEEDTIFSSTIVNNGEDVSIAFIQPVIYEVELDHSPRDVRFFLNGYTSFSGTGSFNLEEVEIESYIHNQRQVHRNFHIPRQTEPGCLTSSLFGMLSFGGDSFLLVGFLKCSDYYTQVRTELSGNTLRIIAQIQFENLLLPANTKIKLPDIFVSSKTPIKAVTQYIDLLAANMEVKIERQIPAGWCTWYHYFMNIDEKEFLKNLETAGSFKPEFRIFQLDDGYEPCLGSWLETNDKFPSGLKGLAEKVKDAGFIPGIWTAPFIVRKTAPVIQENPDWILKDKKGKPVKAMWNPSWGTFGYAYSLDVSRPDVMEFLTHIFTTLYNYGFRFFKLDFLFSASLPGKFYNSKSTSLQIIREALGAIRVAVRDSYLLGCGCPLDAGTGIVDSMRIGNDVTPYWSNYVDQIFGGGFEHFSTKNSIRNSITRAFMHDKLFQNDPDCLITRRVDNKLTKTETFTLGQVNAMTGGPMMISDDLNSLHSESKDLLKEIFSLNEKIRSKKRTFFAPDFMENKMPELQVAMGEDDAYLGVYNFSSTPEKQAIDLSTFIEWDNYAVKEYFSGKAIPVENHNFATDVIEAHDSQLYLIEAVI